MSELPELPLIREEEKFMSNYIQFNDVGLGQQCDNNDCHKIEMKKNCH